MKQGQTVITSRHRKAAKNLGKYRTEKEALVKANYSESYAQSGHIKETKGWQDTMRKALPDRLLLKVHKEGLEATSHVSGSKFQDEKDVADYSTRHKYLDSGYKLRGDYAPVKIDQRSIELSADLVELAETFLKAQKDGKQIS